MEASLDENSSPIEVVESLPDFRLEDNGWPCGLACGESLPEYCLCLSEEGLLSSTLLGIFIPGSLEDDVFLICSIFYTNTKKIVTKSDKKTSYLFKQVETRL